MIIKCKKCGNEFNLNDNFQKEEKEKLNYDEYGRNCKVEGIITCSNSQCHHIEENFYSHYDEEGSGKMSETENFEFNDFEIV